MPGGDRTGPAGVGPMTGRGFGYCAGYPAPGFMSAFGGRGRGGWGRGGGGRGRRRWFYATGITGWQRAAHGWPGYPPPAVAPFAPAAKGQELDALKRQAEYFEGTLQGIRERIEEIEAQSRDET